MVNLLPLARVPQNSIENNACNFPKFSAEEETEFAQLMHDYTVKHLKRDFRPFENSYMAIVVSNVKKLFQTWFDEIRKEAQAGKHHIKLKVGLQNDIGDTLSQIFSHKIGCNLALISQVMTKGSPGGKRPSNEKLPNAINDELFSKTKALKVKLTWSPTNEFIYPKDKCSNSNESACDGVPGVGLM